MISSPDFSSVLKTIAGSQRPGRYISVAQVWTALLCDLRSSLRELLAVYASCYLSNINTIVFLKKVLETRPNKPVVLAEGEPWYP